MFVCLCYHLRDRYIISRAHIQIRIHMQLRVRFEQCNSEHGSTICNSGGPFSLSGGIVSTFKIRVECWNL